MRLEELIYRRGLTQKKLAEKADIAYHTMNQIVLGNRKPRAPTMKAIADALEVDIMDIDEFAEVITQRLGKEPRLTEVKQQAGYTNTAAGATTLAAALIS